MKYGMQTWEIVKVGTRISTIEIVDSEYFDTEAEAVEAAEAILNEKPEGVARVTVGRFNESAEILDDEYLMDEMI
jgi:uncharacterized protein HemX